MKILAKVARWLFILTLPALLLTATIRIEFSSLRLYENGFEKYNVSQSTISQLLRRLTYRKVA